MARVVLLSLGTDDRLICKYHYDPGLVQALKDAIPYGFREWDAGAKVWRVHQDWGDVLVQTLENAGATVMDKRPIAPVPTAVSPALQEACERLYVAPDAPLAVAEAAYKALARMHHPDVGGDTETMQQLNDAIATFKTFNEVPF